MKDEVENKPYFQILKVMADLQTPRLAEQRTELANALVPVFQKAQVEAVRAARKGILDYLKKAAPKKTIIKGNKHHGKLNTSQKANNIWAEGFNSCYDLLLVEIHSDRLPKEDGDTK